MEYTITKLKKRDRYNVFDFIHFLTANEGRILVQNTTVIFT